jgi:Tol biopolymer transport system component
VGDTNATREVFVRDMVAGTNLLASVAVSGVGGGDESSWEPSISGDGRYVAFTSRASNLVAVDANHASDVFVRDLQAGTTALVSVNTGGSAPGNNDSYAPSISADGRCVLFFSRASNLALGSSSSSINLLWRDLQGATTYLLANNVPEWLGQPAAMTPDGRYVVIAGPSGVTLWDATSAWVVFSATIIGVQNVGISPDGNRIAYATATQLQVVDRLASSNVTIAGATPRTHPGLRFSGDNRFLAYSAAVSSTNEVYLYDFESGANQLASHSFNSSTGGNASADSPEISNDGRFVLYRSAATNLVPNDTNGVPDIFLYDRLGDTNVALSLSSSGASLANNRSLAPAMSADGRTMAFLSWASDLEDGDFNQTSDAFAISPYTPDAIPPFQVAVSSGGLPNQGAFLTWPAVPGKTYRAQFKENLSDQLWQDLNLPVVIAGSTGSLQDITPAAAQRFYRIVAF